MAKIDKLIERLLSKPSNFRWNELEKIMTYFDYEQLQNKGSRRKFVHKGTKKVLALHKRHPDDTLLAYQLNEVISFLEL